MGSQGYSSRRNGQLPSFWIVVGGVVFALLLLLFIIGSTGGTDEAQANEDRTEINEIVESSLTRVGYGDIRVRVEGRKVTLSGEVPTRADVVAAGAVVNSMSQVATVDNRLTFAGQPELGDLGENTGPVASSPISGGVTSKADLQLQASLSGIAARDPIRFETGRNELTADSAPTITQIAQLMADNPGLRIEIGGHTDSDGAEDANLALSQSRADAVLAALIAAGVPDDRMVSIGYGPSQPVATNETGEGKARNRRIEFLVLI